MIVPIWLPILVTILTIGSFFLFPEIYKVKIVRLIAFVGTIGSWITYFGFKSLENLVGNESVLALLMGTLIILSIVIYKTQN